MYELAQNSFSRVELRSEATHGSGLILPRLFNDRRFNVIEEYRQGVYDPLPVE